MRRTIIGIALCAMLVIVLITRNGGDNSQIVEERLLVMGTIVTLSIVPEDDMKKGSIGQAVTSVETTLRTIDSDWKPWGDGALGVVNGHLLAGAPANISSDMAIEIRRATKLSNLSNGYFDPGIGRIISLWQFEDEEHFPSSPPAASHLMAALQAGDSINNLVWTDEAGSTMSTINSASPMKLDFGAYAKGRALDLAVETLRKAGIRSAIVNAGGDLKAIGQRGDRPWRIGIRHPRSQESGHSVLAALQLRDGESVITSGDYERFFIMNDRRYHHILDPKTGFPADGVQSVTVVHEDAALADAASTALFVAPEDQWVSIAAAMGVDAVMRVLHDGKVEVTEALASRLEFPVPTATIIVSMP